MPSVREIAKRVGVSPATVSRVMNNGARVKPEIRQRVLAAVNRAGYVPKVGARVVNYYIAFAYAGESWMGSPFDSALVRGISDRMSDLAFDLVILDLNRARLPGESYSQMFIRKGIRGAILRTNAASRHVCQSIATERFPSVVVGDRFESTAVNFVFSDSRESSRQAVDHLIALGHRRIAISFNSVDDSDHLDRLAGYRAALSAHDIAFDEKLVFQSPASRDGGIQLMRRICGSSLPRPTAIYITDPLTAVSAVGEAQDLGIRIPEDLSVVGFDDDDLRFIVRPHLTAVCQDAAAIGRTASKTLHDLIERPDRDVATRITLPTTFEIHGSTASPTEASAAAPTGTRRTLPKRLKAKQ